MSVAAGPAPVALQPGQKHLAAIRSTIDLGFFASSTAAIVTSVTPPRFVDAGVLRVISMDSLGGELDSYRRGDVRVNYGEPPFGATPRPQGEGVMFTVEILPGIRRVLVTGRFNIVLMDFDLGPTLVEACASEELPHELCATFDSDGDGCRDIDDDDPLVPESVPPTVTVSSFPETLWPPNHNLKEVLMDVVAEDNCTESPEVTLVAVTSSDPDAGVTPGDVAPNKAPDILEADIGTFDVLFQLRAERWPQLDGSRTYNVTYRATDRVGNEATVTLPIRVARP